MAQERNIKNSETEKPEEAGPGKAGEGKPAGTPVTVHSYAGYKQDERPRAFELEGKRLTVLSVKRVWQEESEHGRHRKTVFRVHAHNGRTYDLALDSGTGEWTLEPGEQRQSRG